MIIREGSVIIEAISSFEKGPGRKSAGFYNKGMTISRDMTVALLNSLKPGIALDSMAGTGIRGLRISSETTWKVVLNDRDKRNFEIQQRNLKLNGIDLEVMNEDYFCAVSSRKWDYIDIDPFGTPSGLIEAAILNLKNGGIIGVTMTDTANLEGRSLEKGLRIYEGKGIKGMFSREVATRIFVKYVLERGASLGRSGRPLIVVRDGHFLRIFVEFRKGNKSAQDSLGNLKKVLVQDKEAGPMYVGNLYDPAILKLMQEFQFSGDSQKKFDNFRNEDLMFLFYGNSDGSREVKKSKIVDKINEMGFRAGNTNFSEKGIKTDLDEDEYNRILKSL